MALLDFLKNKKEAEKAQAAKAARKPAAKKAEKVSVAKEVKAVKTESAPKAAQAPAGKFSYVVVKDPHISEKGTQLAENSKYVFKVYENSNKPEIKKAIEGIYGVNVLAVNIIHIPHKKRRLGKTEGFKKAYKKAIVTIKEGQKIEVF